MGKKNTSEVSNGKPSDRTRRKYLQSMGAAGFGLSAFVPLDVNDEVAEIVIVKRGGTPVQTETVPKAWFEQAQQARRVADKWKEQYLPGNGIRSIGLTATDRTVQGLRTKAVDLRLKGETAGFEIPDETNGIQIKVTRNEKLKSNYCYQNKPLQGGVDVNDGGTKVGSVCCRVKRNGNYYLLTARHTFTDTGNLCDTSSVLGEPVYRGLIRLGTVDDVYPEHDSVLVRMSSSDISDSVVTEPGSIDGYLTKNGLDFYISQGFSFKRRGVATCATSADPQSYDNTIDCGNNFLLTEFVFHAGDGAGGDSGGPVYDGSDSINMANMHSAENSAGQIAGAAAYAMYNQQNLTFDT